MHLTESKWIPRDRRRGCYGTVPGLWRSTAFSWIKDNTFNTKIHENGSFYFTHWNTHCQWNTIGKQRLGKSQFLTEFITTACGTYSYHRETNGERKETTNNCWHDTGCPVRVRTEHRLKTCLCVIYTTSKLPAYWLALIRIWDGQSSNFSPQTTYFIRNIVSRTEHTTSASFHSIPTSFRIILHITSK